MKTKTIGLILGGGAGSRLQPLTDSRSKPAVPIGGKYRLIDIPISNCLNSGIKRMFVLTQFNSASLNRHIKNTYHFDLFSQGFVDIFAAQQTRVSEQWFLGTADAVRRLMPRLENYEYEYLMILSGDQLYQMDYTPFLEQHIENDADLSIATIPVIASDAPGFGIMKVGDDGTIGSFIEKPNLEELADWESAVSDEYRASGKLYLASMGIYLFRKRTIQELLNKLESEHDFGKGIIPYAIENGYHTRSFPFDGYWTDIGTIRSFFEANLALADPVPEFNLFDNDDIIYTRPRMLSPSKIFGTQCERALISEGCILNAARIYRSVIGLRSRIGSGTVVINSYNMGQDYYQDIEEVTRQNITPFGIGADCHIENAIIDRNCQIGDGTVIRGGTELKDEQTDTYWIRDGVVVVKKWACINPGSKIGLPLP